MTALLGANLVTETFHIYAVWMDGWMDGDYVACLLCAV